MDDLTRPLARVLYDAHAESRRLKTKWRDLNSEEKRHYAHMAAAALAFWADYGEMIEEETTG